MVHFYLEELPLCIKKSEVLFTLFCVFSCILMEKMIGSRGQVANLGVVFGPCLVYMVNHVHCFK